MKQLALIIISLFVMFSVAFGEDDPFAKLQDNTMIYFTPMTGSITSVDGTAIEMSIDSSDQVKPGMRLKILREGSPFIHPVTKEFLGKVESTVGKVEIKNVKADSYDGILIEGEAQEGDKVRISETKVKLFFCQDENIDWYLADEFYRKLKGTGRIEMIDTALETGDEKIVIDEARKQGAEVALLLTAQEDKNGTLVREQVFWVSDGSRFIDEEIVIDTAFAKEIKFGEEFFAPKTAEAVLSYDLPFGARFISTGDFDGDKKQEILLSTGRNAQVYMPAVDLQFLWEAKGPAKGYHIWIDTIDLNRNGKDELVITSMITGKVVSDTEELVTVYEGGEVISYIYELEGSEFRKLWEGKYFTRKIGNGLFVQSYSNAEGFAGAISEMVWDGEYKVTGKVTVPAGVNIYDFVYIKGSEGEQFIFAYDEGGFLNLYNQDGIRTWRSSASTGGFRTTFKLKSRSTYIDRGVWSVKDRLIPRHREVLVVERIPFLKQAQGIGYKNSRIKNYWWNGFSMEESILINDIYGSVLDYAVAGDRIIVLASPLLGIKFGNILKGESPLGTLLYMYSVKGR